MNPAGRRESMLQRLHRQRIGTHRKASGNTNNFPAEEVHDKHGVGKARQGARINNPGNRQPVWCLCKEVSLSQVQAMIRCIRADRA